jgi:outer membrane receptor protein involved in Fe transport
LTCSPAAAQVIDLPDVDVTAEPVGGARTGDAGARATPRVTRPPGAHHNAGDHAHDQRAVHAGDWPRGVRHRHRHDHLALPTVTPRRSRRLARPSSDLLSREPGVQVTNLFGGVNGARSQVDMRGFGAAAASNTLLLINGRRVTDLDLVGFDIASIPRESIERVEITRGNSGAVLYGDGAVGGVINIVTKTGVACRRARLDATVGSFNYREDDKLVHGSRALVGSITATRSTPTAIAITTYRRSMASPSPLYGAGRQRSQSVGRQLVDRPAGRTAGRSSINVNQLVTTGGATTRSTGRARKARTPRSASPA